MIMRKSPIYLIVFILSAWSCSKDSTVPDTSPPDIITVDLYTGCRISSEQTDVLNNNFYDLENRTLTYDIDGFISVAKSDYSNKGAPFPVKVAYQYAFSGGKLQSIATPDNIEKEVYEYTDGFLTKIKLASTNNIDYLNYVITIKNDVQGRPVELADNRGFKSTVIHDSMGNIIEVKKVDNTGKEVYKMLLSQYDGMKSTYELYKGVYFDNSIDISEYMDKPLFNTNAGGNPRTMKIYRNQSLEADLDLAYQYSSEGYPTSIRFTEKTNGSTYQKRFNLKGCK